MSELSDEPVTTQLDMHPDDPDDEWSTARVRSGVRMHVPTAVLLAMVVLAGGFWGGAVAQKHHAASSASSTASALASRLAAARGAGAGTAGRAGFTGAGGFAGAGGGGAGSAAAGIVTGVQGNILFVTDATTGNLIKVVVGPAVSVTRTAKSSLTGLQTGDTVVVQGTKAANGNVTATAVRATGQDVTTTGSFSGGSLAGGNGG